MTKKTLMVFPQGIGDFLYPLDQILLRLEQSNERFHFDFIIQYKQNEELIKSFVKNNTSKIYYTSKSILRNLKLIFSLIFKKYDYLIIDPNLNFSKSLFFSILIYSKYKIYKKSKLGSIFFSHQIGDKYLHLTKDRHKQMFEIANILENKVSVYNNEKFNLPNFIKKNTNKDKKEKIIGIIPGSGDLEKIKRWPKDYFIEFLKLPEITNIFQKVYLFGSQSERELLNYIKENINQYYEVEIFNNDFVVSLNNLNKCSFFLSNDNGLLHFVRSLEIDHISIHGPTFSPKLYLNLKDKNILRTGIECSPCIYRLGRKGCGDEKCLKQLYPKDVLNSFIKNFK